MASQETCSLFRDSFLRRRDPRPERLRVSKENSLAEKDSSPEVAEEA